ncbi:hypothetical protein [Flavobacterium psychrotrophum]|uniref:hypothetical protein n=1 Tax=Flavobacterium psychrotrophum TaxID=2294119 RepID=UPI000E31367D|nr:hypothetical protein [Flavobacterium psychrotrophum]
MKNLTLRQYTALRDTLTYDSILEYLNPKNTFANKQMDISAMPYANVKYCIRLLPKVTGWAGIQKLFEICFGVSKRDFWRAPITEYFAARKFMIAEFTRIIETEARLLQTLSTDSHLWHMAGADKLKPYSDTLPLLQLGKMFGQYPFDLGRKPYGEIFSLLAQTKTQNEVEAEYSKLSRQ